MSENHRMGRARLNHPGRALATVGTVLAALVLSLLPALAPAFAAPAQAAALNTSQYSQISDQAAADPGMSYFNGTYYLYATGESNTRALSIFTSTSADAPFTYAGPMYSSLPTGFAAGSFWAPEVIASGDGYYAVFTAKEKSRPQPCLYYGYSSSPTGPFTGPTRLLCDAQAAKRWEAIDPSIFAQGPTSYLVWRRGQYPQFNFQIRARAITIGGGRIAFAAGSTSLLLAKQNKSAIMEAPTLVAAAGKIWLFVSRGYGTNAYHTDVWVSSAVNKPFTFSRTLMATGDLWGYGPGGADVLLVGNTYYLAYHALTGSTPTTKRPAGVKRVVRIVRLSFTSGAPVLVGQSQVQPWQPVTTPDSF